MSHSTSSSVSHSSLRLLEQNPCLSDSLLADCGFNLAEVTTIMEPLLEAKKRCQNTSFYIQGITTGRTTFLATNLNHRREIDIPPIASSWLLGRGATCAVSVPDRSVSRCHAAIGYHPAQGFYLTDVGSSNGTWVNGQRLVSMERQSLRDGDLIRVGDVRIAFFAVSRDRNPQILSDVTCF